MNKKILRIILISLLAAVFAVSVGAMIFYQIEARKAAAEAEEAARLAGLTAETQSLPPETAPPTTQPPPETVPPTTEPPVETDPPVEETEPPEEPPLPLEALPEDALSLADIDLSALREVNPDVVGWISIPGTVVSYPLMQGTDDTYYLSHNWKKARSYSGSLMLASYASPDLTDFHTIIYGHHMRNDSMFGTLRYYFRGPDYWRAHPSVYIVLDDMIYRYDIFAAQEAAVNGAVYRLDLEEKHLEAAFLRYCIEHSVLDTGLIPKVGRRIVTLSTCTGDLDPAYRWVVHGALAQRYDRTE